MTMALYKGTKGVAKPLAAVYEAAFLGMAIGGHRRGQG
jgi:hypothetical protein